MRVRSGEGGKNGMGGKWREVEGGEERKRVKKFG